MTRPSAEFNRPYRKQERCIPVARGLTSDPPVLYADGAAVGPGYTMPRDPRWDPDTTVSSSCADQPGCVRIDMTETVGAGDRTLYFHKGGQGYEPRDVSYGHVDAAVLRDPGPAVFAKGVLDEHGAEPRDRRGHGAGRAAPVMDVSYRVRPRPIGPDGDGAWFYKHRDEWPGRSLAGARYSKYGDAGPTQGGRDRSFAYLCWSWVREPGLGPDPRAIVRGGGAVRALVPPGQIVDRCDVESITAPAWNREGERVGDVVVIYVRLPVPGGELYGWIVHSHLTLVDQGRARERTLHLEDASGS